MRSADADSHTSRIREKLNLLDFSPKYHYPQIVLDSVRFRQLSSFPGENQGCVPSPLLDRLEHELYLARIFGLYGDVMTTNEVIQRLR
jgi:hypothetical protein